MNPMDAEVLRMLKEMKRPADSYREALEKAITDAKAKIELAKLQLEHAEAKLRLYELEQANSCE